MKRFHFTLSLVLALASMALPAARAQVSVYVSFGASIQIYDSDTGAFMSQFATGLANPWGLTIDSSGRLYASVYSGDTVAAYDTVNGSVISTSFTNPGLFTPQGIATFGGNLYVASQGSQRISLYDAATGVLGAANFIPNLLNPTAMVIDGAGRLFVTHDNHAVSVYNAATGALIAPNFITGLVTPMGLALDDSGRLYVTAVNGNTVGVYDANTGALINANLIAGLTSPRAIALDAAGQLYVSSFNTSNSTYFVGKYDPFTGAVLNPSLLAVGSSISSLAFLPAIPEPAANAALAGGLGLIAAVWLRRRRRTWA